MIGRVRLRVADLEGVRSYYERTIGLRTLAEDGGVVTLGAGTPLVELIGDPSAPPAPRGSTGLFHLALLVPDRAELARAIQRVVGSGERFTGASDHFVSEALYLSDPEGNGIEIYRDRPREEWQYEPDGELRMGTVALDLNAVLAEMPRDDDPGMPDGTVVGHVHLHVSDLVASQAFYADRLGLDVMVRSYPGALFLAHGGYHHHIGLNTWQGSGGGPPERARGLVDFELTLPDAREEGPVTDPSGNRVLLRTG